MEEIEFQSWKGLKIFLVLFFDFAEEVLRVRDMNTLCKVKAKSRAGVGSWSSEFHGSFHCKLLSLQQKKLFV